MLIISEDIQGTKCNIKKLLGHGVKKCGCFIAPWYDWQEIYFRQRWKTVDCCNVIGRRNVPKSRHGHRKRPCTNIVGRRTGGIGRWWDDADLRDDDRPGTADSRVWSSPRYSRVLPCRQFDIDYAPGCVTNNTIMQNNTMKTCSAPITIKCPPAQWNSHFVINENKIELKTRAYLTDRS